LFDLLALRFVAHYYGEAKLFIGFLAVFNWFRLITGGCLYPFSLTGHPTSVDDNGYIAKVTQSLL
jgi:hypothetical protein